MCPYFHVPLFTKMSFSFPTQSWLLRHLAGSLERLDTCPIIIHHYRSLKIFHRTVNHWSELGGRPDSEESLNSHYHISLNVNFPTSPHYQEGKMLAAIAWWCLNKILYLTVFIFCFSPSFPFTYLGAFHLNHCLLDSPLWIIICSDTTISENGAVNIYVNAEVVIFDSNVPGLDLKLSVHIDRAACQSPFCLTLLSD